MKAKKRLPPRAPADSETTRQITREYNNQKANLQLLLDKTEKLLNETYNHKKYYKHSIQTRLKQEQKILQKIQIKGYKKLNNITDIAGLRIITYYADAIDRIAKTLRKEFIIDEKSSIDYRNMNPHEFGYSALHYICKYKADRTRLSEYKSFKNIRFEIQITTVLMHAWAELEHDLYDAKELFSDDMKRKYSRIAAILEVADTELVNLKKQKIDIIKSHELRQVNT